MNKVILRRRPPGDRWARSDQGKIIATNLTDACALIAREHKVKVFVVDALGGTISIDDGTEEPVYEHSLYEE